jgi:hypothetical protein
LRVIALAWYGTFKNWRTRKLNKRWGN